MLPRRQAIRFALLSTILFLCSSCGSNSKRDESECAESVISGSRRARGFRVSNEILYDGNSKSTETDSLEKTLNDELDRAVPEIERALAHYLSGRHPYGSLKRFLTPSLKPPRGLDIPWSSSSPFRMSGVTAELAVLPSTPKIVKQKLAADFLLAQEYPGGIFSDKAPSAARPERLMFFANETWVNLEVRETVATQDLALKSLKELSRRAKSQPSDSFESRHWTEMSREELARTSTLVLNVVNHLIQERKVDPKDLRPVIAYLLADRSEPRDESSKEIHHLIYLMPLQRTRELIESLVRLLPPNEQAQFQPLIDNASPQGAAPTSAATTAAPPARASTSPKGERTGVGRQ